METQTLVETEPALQKLVRDFEDSLGSCDAMCSSCTNPVCQEDKE